MERRKGWLLLIVAAALMLSTTALGETYTVLRYNDQGTAVSKLQVALNQLGYATGGTEGKYGPATEKAVRQFQEDHGLTVDGKAGSATQTLVYQLIAGGGTNSSTAASASGYFGGNYNTLEYGDRGSRVTLLQQALNSLGFSAGNADGRFGTGTQRAVTAFQSAQKLTADGKAGKLTLTRIEQVLSGQVSNATPAPATPTPTPSGASSATAVPTRTLRKGYQGDDVKSVQTRLKELGYYTGSIDGKYGTGTMAAVTAFQRNNALQVDGLAGSGTYKVLYSSSAVAASATVATPTPTPTPSSATATPTRTLSSGDTGDDVKSVQTRLKELGYYTGTVDGKYGTGTVAAVTAFQQNNKLTADGKAGANTYKVLYSTSAVAAGSGSTSSGSTSTGTAPTRTLRSGDTGDDVKSVQTRLKELGYYTGSIDGKYGTGTVAAVTAFQRNNKLTADGKAGTNTYKVLYSSSAVAASSGSSSGSTSSTSGGPSKSEIKLLHWYNDVKPVLKGQKSILIYDPATGISFTLHLYSLGRHADVEPMTADDTAKMMEAFGGVETWTPKFVYVKLPNGVWTVATMHNVAHGGQSIKTNNFNGQNCVHFLRDMDECTANDPKYGVTNQKALRAGWKALTGETIN